MFDATPVDPPNVNHQCQVCNADHNPSAVSPLASLLPGYDGSDSFVAQCDDLDACTHTDVCAFGGVCDSQPYTGCLSERFNPNDATRQCEVRPTRHHYPLPPRR